MQRIVHRDVAVDIDGNGFSAIGRLELLHILQEECEKAGVRLEFDTMVRNQADRILHDLDVVKREEFEAVKEMARIAREENEALKARIAALEAKLGSGSNP